MSETIERLNPRRQPRQARSRQMQADILAAAADILRRRGLPALNTNAVAERAGVSVGSLYQYFPGKDAILAALVREMRREMRGDLLEAVARSKGQALAPAVGALVEASLRHHARDPALTDALERAEDDLPMDAEMGALKADMAALVTGILARHGVEEPERTARDLVALCHGMVHAALRAGETDLACLSRRADRAALGYLGVPTPRRSPAEGA